MNLKEKYVDIDRKDDALHDAIALVLLEKIHNIKGKYILYEMDKVQGEVKHVLEAKIGAKPEQAQTIVTSENYVNILTEVANQVNEIAFLGYPVTIF